ncbi:hypothetical protein A5482_014680 (plasmid) [Cyanobacterium sp. IPPAS B-1200]|nr:hypothetical protein [Cyanobacterium sp. IPPAS B-1200]
MMFNWIFKVVNWFSQLWGRLDEEAKRQIIEIIIEAFQELLRVFYNEK